MLLSQDLIIVLELIILVFLRICACSAVPFIVLSGSYNITQKELGLLSINLSRDLHCWQMNINMSPVGKYRFFSINISPKSSMLRDIKVNRTRYFYDL